MPIFAAAGDVTYNEATLWVQAEAAEVEVRVIGGWGQRSTLAINPESRSGHLQLEGLWPNTEYRVVLEAGSESGEARFRTPPRKGRFEPVRIGWGGDLGGQDACRDVAAGYTVFAPLLAAPPDVFVAVGDLIYADGVCNAEGRWGNAQVPGPAKATDVAGFRAWWAYNLADPNYAALRARVPQVNVWDDHEVVNDFGPSTDTREKPPYTAGTRLLPMGLQALREANPMPQEGPLYRSLRWGAAVELFVLDVRSYRSANELPDGPEKTLLGAEQKAWLIEAVTSSTATWKVIVSSSPFTPPSSKPVRDGWATGAGGQGGFTTEALEVLRALSAEKNLAILSTDVHFAAAYALNPFEDAPDFAPVELISGPLSAAFFPSMETEPRLQAKTLFFQNPPRHDVKLSWDAAQESLNVGVIEVGEDRALTARWINAKGREIAALRFEARE